MQVYVLDAQLQPAPVGVPGELYISGDGLARGYLDRPDLTAERFIPNPFAIQAQDKDRADLPTYTRLYKTGDVARWMVDGNIEFLGRSDNQVKIRGYRIELGEIEAQLIQHPAVKEAVVVARDNGLNGMHPAELKTLIAYIVPNSNSGNGHIEQTGDIEQLWPQLQEYLKRKLPAYMVPSAFVKMDALPLTPSGKVDRRALPEPGFMTRGREPYLAPRDTLEFQLVKIWEELLNVRPISLSDKFFDLGGHSLLALRLAAQIQDQLGRSIPLSAILEGTTIERLANILRNSSTEQRCSPIVHIQPQGSKIPFFCVHPAGGNVFSYAELARQLGQDQPFYGLEEPYLLGSNQLDQSIQEKAAAYIKAMKAVQPEGPYQLGGWSMGGAVAYEMAQQLHCQGEAINLLVLLDTPAPNHHGTQLSEEEINTYLLLGFACFLKEQYNLPLSITEDLLSLGPDTQIDYLIEQVQTMATPLSNFDHYLRQVYRVYQSHLRALWEYKPQAYAKQILMIQASEPTRLSFQGSLGMKLQDPELLGVGDPQNWARFTSQPLETFCVPGSHWTMLALPHVQVLAAHLKQYLN
jgi:thioesterase domain-containing protein/acyl carrier protein